MLFRDANLWRKSIRLRGISWSESLPTTRDPLNHTKNHEKEGPTKSISQFVFKQEATDLNRCAPIDGRTDQQRANHAALAIDVRVDGADSFAARGSIEAYANAIVVYSLVTKNVLARLQ